MKGINVFRFASLGALCFSALGFSSEMVLQKLDYTDHLQTFYNPDRGFYRPQVIHFDITAKEVTPTNRFIHLRADISAFSSNAIWNETDANGRGKTQDLTKEMLDSFRKYLDRVREKNATVIVRFCYDPWYQGKGNQEPEQEWILKHTRQLSAVYNEYKDVITFVEQGMYGPYGEQHTSAISNPLYVGEGLKELLQNTDKDVDVGPRNPIVLARGLGFSPDTKVNEKGDTTLYNYNISFDINHPYFQFKADSLGEDIYRVGLFNDGYLGTQYDYGTWGADCRSSICREEGVAFLETYGKHVPYGGEALTTAGGYKTINSPSFLSYEGFRTHTSYLNIEWNNNLINSWRTQEFSARDTIDKPWNSYYENGELKNTAFQYIDAHLGYRYVLRESKMYDSLGVGSDIVLELKIQNVGFGNMTKKRPVSIVLRAKNASASDSYVELPEKTNFDPQEILSRTVVLKTPFDAAGNPSDWENIQSETTFDGINKVRLVASLPDSLPEGEYDVFLRISQYGNWPSDSNYSCVRFANDSLYFEPSIGANYVGSFVLSSSAEKISPIIKTPSLAKVEIRMLSTGISITQASRVDIFDLKGQNLMSKDISENEWIPLENLPRGNFLVRASGKKGTAIKMLRKK